MKKLKYILIRIGEWIMFLLTGKGTIANEAIAADICDFSGQGRDKYGR